MKLEIFKKRDDEGFELDKHGNRISPDDGLTYYSHKRLFECAPEAQYYQIWGERSSGKTYDLLKYSIEEYVKHGHEFAYIRRQNEDIVGKRAEQICQNLVRNNEISKLTKGEYNDVRYYAGKLYLSRYDKETGKRITSPKPMGYLFSLSASDHDKSAAFPNIKNIIFDEFLSRHFYLVDEFVIFTNLLSTIIRERNDVKVFMLGNTVNKYCPYFKEMGLTNIKKMKPGDINIYRYGDSGLTVAVEYTDGTDKKKPSDVYFAFDNPKLKMITSGAWELDIYPHCPKKYRPKDIKFTYFINFDEELLQCEIIKVDKCLFTFIHEKTTPIKNEDRDIIYTPRYDARRNWRRNILKPYDKVGEIIYNQFKTDSVYYQDNEVGDLVMNYLNWCKQQ